MTNQVRVLAVVPARAGSKSVKMKNIAQVAGKPLIAYTISAALSVPWIDRVVLSTDSEKIASIAQTCGAETPFLRPPQLAQDDSPGNDPILHATRWLESHESYRPDYVMALQPTSPLRTAKDVEAAIQIALEQRADAVVSVSPVKQHPYWMKSMSHDGRLADFMPIDFSVTRRQELPPVYALNGAIYLARRDILIDRETWYTDRTYGYVMPPERSLDIDTPWDLHLANLILGGSGT